MGKTKPTKIICRTLVGNVILNLMQKKSKQKFFYWDVVDILNQKFYKYELRFYMIFNVII